MYFLAYPTSTGSWERYFDLGNGAADNNILFARNGTSANLNFTVYSPNGNGSVEAPNVIELNKWQYFSVSQLANGIATIYKNGVSIATGAVTVPRNINRPMNYIGMSTWNDTQKFAGQMSSLSIWNRALTSTEMASASTRSWRII